MSAGPYEEKDGIGVSPSSVVFVGLLKRGSRIPSRLTNTFVHFRFWTRRGLLRL